MDKTCGTCRTCGGESKFGGRCGACIMADFEYIDDDSDCHNCGGEGFTYGCGWDWQCDTWDGDSCLCTRRCEWCQPLSESEQTEREALRQVMAGALAQPKESPHD